MLKDKVQALLKSLPQRPRSRFVPLPESATRLAAQLSQPQVLGHGSLTDALLKLVRDADQPGREARRLQARHAARRTCS